MSKKVIVIILMVFMIAAVGGCGAKEKMNEKISESVTEGIINKALDGEGKVDLDGDKITIKGEDGEEFNFGEAEWPDSGAAQQIPELNEGTVVSAMNSEQFCMIMLEEIEQSAFDQYLEEIKDQGFTNDSVEFTSDTGYSYSASKDENTMISLMYDSEAQSVTINYEISEE
jgi:Cu/Ag efflux protein CusF